MIVDLIARDGDGPRRIRAIPEEYVVRQLSGSQLIANVTQPLPLRIIGGTEKDIPEYMRKTLPAQRNPEPKNGVAKELFASDLLAVGTESLALPHEEREKSLLNIGESLGLRGAEIDKLNSSAVEVERKKTVQTSLDDLKKMTLTVVDGDFPRSVLAKQNLTFSAYRMPAARNKRESYDAVKQGPAGKQPGVRKVGALAPMTDDSNKSAVAAVSPFWMTAPIFGMLLVGMVLWLHRRSG